MLMWRITRRDFAEDVTMLGTGLSRPYRAQISMPGEYNIATDVQLSREVLARLDCSVGSAVGI